MSNRVELEETDEAEIIRNIKKDLLEREISCEDTTAIRDMLVHLFGMIIDLHNDIIELKIVNGLDK